MAENDSKSAFDATLAKNRSIFTRVSSFLAFKSEIQSIASSLERIATVLERGIPPIEAQKPLPRLTESDFSRSSNETTFEQEVLENALQLNPDLAADPDTLARVRDFVHQQSRL